MTGEKKNIAELTDEEIDALPPEELLALQHGEAREGGEEEEEDGGEGAGGDGAGDETKEEEEEETGDGGEPLTPEQLQALADEADEEDEDEDDPDPTSDMVPRSRLNKALERGKDLSLVVKALIKTGDKAPAAAPVEAKPEPVVEAEPEFLKYDFKAKSREVIKLIAEGEEEKAAALQDEIEDTRTQVTEYRIAKAQEKAKAEAVTETNQTLAKDKATADLGVAATALFEKFPFLNNQVKGANEAAILAVNAKAKQLVAKGRTPAAALTEAGEKIGGQFAKLLGIKPAAAVVDDKTKGKQPAKDTRTPDALKRNLSLQQPPQQKSGVGTRDKMSSISIADMTDKQLDELEKNDPAAFAELRGDHRIG